MPVRIFLSYGHDNNEELVQRIKADLEKRGHDVWFDKNEIKFGDEWRRSITDGILKSNRVLSFLSKHSTRDPGVCRDEIAIAIGVKGGNIQTILVESEQEVQPPVNIGHIQWLDMHDWKEHRDAGESAWGQWYQAKLAEIIRVVESVESRRFAGEIETLKGYLKPIQSEARICHLLSKGFYGRQWLFEAVEKWRQGNKLDSRMFWMMGVPGVGKSAFAAQLTHLRGDVVIAAQFCEWDKPDHRNAPRVVRSLAFQLAARLPDYRKILLTLPEIADLDGKDAAELFDYLLANPLRSVINGGRERYLIVIDALDEAGEAGRNPLVEMLARNAQRLPDWLGLVVTSRPEFDVKTPMQAMNPFPLDTRSESNRADIRDYLWRELALPLENRPDADRQVDQILEKSEGVLLYVERICADVQQGHLSLDRPEQFPQGLGGTFAQYFQRQFPDQEEYEESIEPAVGAILAAHEPLPLEILQKLFGWSKPQLRKWLREVGSLFPVTMGDGCEVIKPYHKSLADWLVHPEDAGRFVCSIAEGHLRLAACGWRNMQEKPMDVPDYIRRNLAWHLAQARRWDDLATLVETKKLDLLSRWIDGGMIDDGVFCLSGLVKHLRSRGNDSSAAELATQLARVYSRAGQYEEAENCLREVLNETSFWTGRRESAIALHELGSLYLYRHQYIQAESFYRQALRRCEWGLPRYQDEAAANLLGLATINQELARFRKALSLARRAERITMRIGDVPHQLAALRLRALSYRGLGNYDAAETVMTSALVSAREAAVEHEFPRLSMVSGWLTYDRSTIAGRGLADASDYFRSALSGAQACGNYYILAEAKLSLAWCSVVSDDSGGDTSDVRAFMDFPLSSRRHLGLWCGRLVLEAVCAQKSGDANAEELYEAAIKFCEENDNVAWRVRALVGLGCLLSQSGRTVEAASAWRKALEVARGASVGLGRVTDTVIERCRLRPDWGPR